MERFLWPVLLLHDASADGHGVGDCAREGRGAGEEPRDSGVNTLAQRPFLQACWEERTGLQPRLAAFVPSQRPLLSRWAPTLDYTFIFFLCGKGQAEH